MSTPIFSRLTDKQVVTLLANGGVGVIPTDTLYGLVAQAANETAVARLLNLKDRKQKPGTIIAANIDQLVELGVKARYVKAVETYWPNSLSIVIPTGHDLAYLHQGEQSLALRIPKDETLQKLLLKTGVLLTSSANHPGEAPATTIQEAVDYFNDQVDFYVDGGDLSGRQPSTIIRVVDDAIEVLRPGAVTIDETTGRITS